MMIKAQFKKTTNPTEDYLLIYFKGTPDLVSKEYNILKKRLIKQGYELK